MQRNQTLHSKLRDVQVLDLEEEMTLLNICYKRNEINPLIPWVQLVGGFMCSVRYR